MLAGDLTGSEGLYSHWQERLGFVHPWLLSCRAFSELAQGRVQAARAAYQQLELAAADQPGLAFFAGDTALVLGEIDKAIDWYQRSLEEGEFPIVMTRIRHARETQLRANPRYRALLAQMRLDDASLRQFGLRVPSNAAEAAGARPQL